MSWLIDTTWEAIGRTAISALAIYLVVVAVVRMNGHRTFTKMSGYDFATTVAIGSIVAAVTLNRSTPVVEGVVAIFVLIGSQRTITELRRRTRIEQVIDNAPVLVMAHGRIISDGLDRSGLSEQDLYSTLRSAGVSNLKAVTAVIVEPTGDRSVITDPIEDLDAAMFASIRGVEHLGITPTGGE